LGGKKREPMTKAHSRHGLGTGGEEQKESSTPSKRKGKKKYVPKGGKGKFENPPM